MQQECGKQQEVGAIHQGCDTAAGMCSSLTQESVGEKGVKDRVGEGCSEWAGAVP